MPARPIPNKHDGSLDLTEHLRAEGYLDPNDPIDPSTCWQHVLADLTIERSDGHIDVSDLKRLFERLDAGPPSEPAADDSEADGGRGG